MEIRELRKSTLYFYGGNMEKIKRPKKVSRNESSYLTNEAYQDLVNNQLKNIYDKLDEIVESLN